ncbi:(4Fe-4S)-binding protein [Streptomyces xanthochromogenes]|uniref:Ferredoxin n=1 Tax=Streptomyces xanthochromogenes TaxID=67384 RepID=A0ABQ2ZNN5_9ACTN|nr:MULTISPECIES: (4Fe-4S)-binding protein [Streptomyces]MYV93448.1 ferredoxin [Streptomyces sp. SID1034]GGY18812.1 ferredoxin [Streptomyces xanthochromogenes]
MRVSADREVCVGAGLCALTAPAVFDQDDDGLVDVLTPDPDRAQQPAARQAVNLCPSGAVSIAE